MSRSERNEREEGITLGADIFETIGGSEANGGRGQYIRDGRYEFVLQELKFVDAPKSGRTFIAKLYVKAATAVNELDKDGKPVIPNSVGSTADFIQQVDKYKHTAPGNIKGFFEQLVGRPYGTDEKGKAEFSRDIQKALAENQPLRGASIKCSTYRSTIKGGPNKGDPLTLMQWQNVVQTAEQIQTGKALLGGSVAVQAEEVAGEDEAA